MIRSLPRVPRGNKITKASLVLGFINSRSLHVLPWLLLFSACHREEPDSKPVVAVRVARAEISNLSLYVRAPATLFPKEQANIAARTAGPIRQLRARKGDSVAAGQVLAVLENHDLEAQCLEAEAAVMDAQANLEKISSGTLVADVERARGQVATTEATLNQAQKIYDRRAELFQQGAIPQRDLLVSQTELAQAKTGYEVARKSLELLETQSRGKEIRQAESRLAQAKARLQLAEAQLQFTELRSPFAGSITEQFLYPGDMAKPEVPVFTVMDLSVAIARAQVPEEQTSAIHIGQKGAFTPADKNQTTFTGRISVINRSVDLARRTVEVWCEIPNTSRQLRSGVFGSLSILTGTATQSVVVPLTAVQFKEGTRSGWVMVVDEKRTAHKREVEAGEIIEGKAQIKQGLRPNELVIIEGGYGLPDGTEVRFGQEKSK